MDRAIKIWIIRKLWIDPLENQFGHAVGWSPIGFVTNPDLAHKISISEFVMKNKHPWPLEFCNDHPGSVVPVFIAEETTEIVSVEEAKNRTPQV